MLATLGSGNSTIQPENFNLTMDVQTHRHFKSCSFAAKKHYTVARLHDSFKCAARAVALI